MPIPDFQSILLPLLQSCADGQEHDLRETIAALATSFQLTAANVGEVRNLADVAHGTSS